MSKVTTDEIIAAFTSQHPIRNKSELAREIFCNRGGSYGDWCWYADTRFSRSEVHRPTVPMVRPASLDKLLTELITDGVITRREISKFARQRYTVDYMLTTHAEVLAQAVQAQDVAQGHAKMLAAMLNGELSATTVAITRDNNITVTFDAEQARQLLNRLQGE